MPQERRILGAIVLLLAYLGWLGGCAFMPAELTLGWAGLALLLLTVCLPFDTDFPPAEARVKSKCPAIVVMRDPIFWLGLLFLLLLGVQSFNAAGPYSPPPFPHAPSSINRAASLRVVHWFLPLWALVLAVRNRLLTPASRILLAQLIALIAGMLALFGIVQMALGGRWGYGLAELPEQAHFFASFGYSNHAGAYFVLTFALAAALLLDSLFSRALGWTRWRVLLGLSALLSLVAACLSFSHAGLILSLGAAVVASGAGMLLSWKHWGPVARFNVLLSIGALGMLGFFLISGVGERDIRGEGDSMFGRLDVVEKLEGRLFMSRAALKMWKDAPWFGVGGWGYRSLLADYIEEESRGSIGPGQANAHCDPLQFLAEFGAVGSLLLLGCVGTMLIPLLATGAWRRPGVFLLLVGLLATLMHSLVDLPFRNPAILCTWGTILAICSRSPACPAVLNVLSASLGQGRRKRGQRHGVRL